MYFSPSCAPYYPRPRTQNVPQGRPPCFLTNRLEHARYVLLRNMHAFASRPQKLNELPETLLPPLPPTCFLTMRELKDLKDEMYQQYTALYWERALENLQDERGYEIRRVVDGDLTRYASGYVYYGVYCRYEEGDFRPPLVSQSAMESIRDLIPHTSLNFHPMKILVSSMELSLKGINRSIFLARENAAFFNQVAQDFIDYLIDPEMRSVLNKGYLAALNAFLERILPELNVALSLGLSFVEDQGEDLHKLTVARMCYLSFRKFIERLKYALFIIEIHQSYDTDVVPVVEDLGRFQHALHSIEEWNVTGR